MKDAKTDKDTKDRETNVTQLSASAAKSPRSESKNRMRLRIKAQDAVAAWIEKMPTEGVAAELIPQIDIQKMRARAYLIG